MMQTLIVIDNLRTGGVATSLKNFVRSASREMEISLLVFNDEETEKTEFPENVRFLKPQKLLGIFGKRQKEVAARSPLLALYRGFLVVMARLFGGRFSRRLLFPFIRVLRERSYDLAVSFANDDGYHSLTKGCNDFVIKKVRAKRKITFVHCDYENFGGYNPKQEKEYRPLDRIVCVSKSCKESFCRCFPTLSEKVVVCENFIDVERVRRLSDDFPVPFSEGTVNFVTVCRISEEKGLFRAADAFARCAKRGKSRFTWTIVGDGPERERFAACLSELGISDKVILVGEKKNPYPFIKGASVFLLPSFHEAAPMVFGESAALGIPVLTTRTCSAEELIGARRLGWVTDNSEEGLAEGIAKILDGEIILGRREATEDEINRHARQQLADLLASFSVGE